MVLHTYTCSIAFIAGNWGQMFQMAFLKLHRRRKTNAFCCCSNVHSHFCCSEEHLTAEGSDHLTDDLIGLCIICTGNGGIRVKGSQG